MGVGSRKDAASSKARGGACKGAGNAKSPQGERPRTPGASAFAPSRRATDWASDRPPSWGEGTAAHPPASLPCRVLRMEEFFPETYRLDLKHEREAFFTLFDGERLLAGHQAGPGETGSGLDQSGGW